MGGFFGGLCGLGVLGLGVVVFFGGLYHGVDAAGVVGGGVVFGFFGGGVLGAVDGGGACASAVVAEVDAEVVAVCPVAVGELADF